MAERVLLVDDDKNILAAYRRNLGNKFAVDVAENGEKGLAVLKEREPFAVVISDYRMPGMDGIEFLSLARKVAPHTVRIMLTGYADMEKVLGAINEGNVFRFLTKPCPSNVLTGVLEKAIEQYRLVTNEREMVDEALRRAQFEESMKVMAEERLAVMEKKLKSTLEDAIKSMAVVLEKRDPYTANHQRRVAGLAITLAKALGWGDEQTEGLYMAAIVHDIGKIYVPAEILNKPGSLNDLEFAMIRCHPEVGQEILQVIDFPWPIGQIVLQHHERLDGSGYPMGLSGDEILSEARVLAVADVVEAMTSHRPYRQALSLDEALEEISQNAGALYDKNVADACIKLFGEEGFQIPDL